jgi:uncharacterized protein (TIGR02996 family)
MRPCRRYGGHDVTDLDAIYATIIEQPDEDAWRLQYADCLEEQAGDMIDPDAARARAEFVRVQVELARMPLTVPANVLCHQIEWRQHADRIAGTGADVRFDPPSPGASSGVGVLHYQTPNPDRQPLEKRQGQLFTASHARAWGLGDEWRHTVHAHTIEPGYGASTPAALFQRGFIDSVSCDLRTWCGGECEYIGHAGRRCDHGLILLGDGTYDCPACHDTGRVSGIGPAVVRAHPVRRVVTDREPLHLPQWPCWSYTFAPERVNERLPDDLYDAMASHPDCSHRSRTWVGFIDRAAALDALSSALLAWAKSAPV